MRSPNCTSACWMCRGFLSSWRYSVICGSERWRPNQVFHQKRNGISTISQPVAKNRIFCVRDMPRLGLGSSPAQPGVSVIELAFSSGIVFHVSEQLLELTVEWLGDNLIDVERLAEDRLGIQQAELGISAIKTGVAIVAHYKVFACRNGHRAKTI